MPEPDNLSLLIGQLVGKVDSLISIVTNHRDEQRALGERLGVAEQRLSSLEATGTSKLNYINLTLALAAIAATVGGYLIR